eukprot:5960341-Prymnesium_polylepis.2
MSDDRMCPAGGRARCVSSFMTCRAYCCMSYDICDDGRYAPLCALIPDVNSVVRHSDPAPVRATIPTSLHETSTPATSRLDRLAVRISRSCLPPCASRVLGSQIARGSATGVHVRRRASRPSRT